MTTQTNVGYLIRHLNARHLSLVGHEVQIMGRDGQPSEKSTITRNGEFFDGSAKLIPEDVQRAFDVGYQALQVSRKISSVHVMYSDKERAKQTIEYAWLGAAQAYAEKFLGINFTDVKAAWQLPKEAQELLSKEGFRPITCFESHSPPDGLSETVYKNLKGIPDKGDELLAQALDKELNEGYSDFKFMVQRGFESDHRSEDPKIVSRRGLKKFIPAVQQYDATFGATHQPNLESITAELIGYSGKDANEMFEAIGGGFVLGGGIKLVLTTKGSAVISAELSRTSKDPFVYDTKLPLAAGIIEKYLSI